ncbi:YlzJ-like family protein [Geomicrobium sp. JCM 19055]|uniref:YlzJ-like family protein n=1 Tax=Geomicrobium sp. JCM 19055 TaxID=1460649 RepID=UPI00045EDDA9|nr:YlzJ-like family protein [Geomicrobium sp. JCM 19055]GAK01551.1 hypothetical protein JCM19055_4727 [Geomicrobium sp. JCM 19055]
MILYTPLAYEEIFPNEEGTESCYVETETGVVMLEKNIEGEWVVGKLISPNPSDYLDPKYEPGTLWNS